MAILSDGSGVVRLEAEVILRLGNKLDRVVGRIRTIAVLRQERPEDVAIVRTFNPRVFGRGVEGQLSDAVRLGDVPVIQRPTLDYR